LLIAMGLVRSKRTSFQDCAGGFHPLVGRGSADTGLVANDLGAVVAYQTGQAGGQRQKLATSHNLL
jgi:hypothetical protein